jgi:hypothetical protein
MLSFRGPHINRHPAQPLVLVAISYFVARHSVQRAVRRAQIATLLKAHDGAGGFPVDLAADFLGTETQAFLIIRGGCSRGYQLVSVLSTTELSSRDRDPGS